MRSLVLPVITRVVSPLMLLFSVFLLLRGEHAPGGGFSGGLVAATAFVLYAIAFDTATARRLLRVEPRELIGAGLLIMAVTGVLGAIRRGSFLSAVWVDLELPLGAIATLGTPLVFEVGVYLVVVGATLTIFLLLAEE